ncbi:hypothetical protein BDY21DRAFT_75966 [Lineolata rhizophorae]|uniref:Uncharacterized protein n=1 Tax=Lineolata rhizophorae TaxID=578093 RepID=A0A6A6NUH6_9PEZI|nr:hypothetical protein BDY21DRAFT_75966 [Lineolata rhizophorae]
MRRPTMTEGELLEAHGSDQGSTRHMQRGPPERQQRQSAFRPFFWLRTTNVDLGCLGAEVRLWNRKGGRLDLGEWIEPHPATGINGERSTTRTPTSCQFLPPSSGIGGGGGTAAGPLEADGKSDVASRLAWRGTTEAPTTGREEGTRRSPQAQHRRSSSSGRRGTWHVPRAASANAGWKRRRACASGQGPGWAHLREIPKPERAMRGASVPVR